MLMYQNLALHGWCYALLVLRICKDSSAFWTSVIVVHTNLGQLYKYIISLFMIKLHDKYSVISLVHTCTFLFCYKKSVLLVTQLVTAIYTPIVMSNSFCSVILSPITVIHARYILGIAFY